MKRFLVSLAASIALLALPAPALADAGGPGTTFPEQPGANLANACAAVVAAPAVGGGTSNNATANAITQGLLADACFGGS